MVEQREVEEMVVKKLEKAIENLIDESDDIVALPMLRGRQLVMSGAKRSLVDYRSDMAQSNVSIESENASYSVENERQKGEKRCVEKVMLVTETVYDTVIQCHHSYHKRCHTTYVTAYSPVQVEDCKENYLKECEISFSSEVQEVEVDICTQPLVKNCSRQGPIECKTEYQATCSTTQLGHLVEEDVPQCVVEEEESCAEETSGYSTKQKCMTWPVTRCKLVKRKVTKYTPSTKCIRSPISLCGPRSCAMEKGEIECRKKTKTIVHQVPVETCSLQPRYSCSLVSKLVPRLEPKEECVQVPREVCTRIRTNKRKVKKPTVKQWCFYPKDRNSLQKVSSLSRKTAHRKPSISTTITSIPIHSKSKSPFPSTAHILPQFPNYKTPNPEEPPAEQQTSS